MTRVLLLALLFAGCEPSPALAEYDPKMEEHYVRVIVCEAADQGLAGAIAVAEVLRNRDWSSKGFCGINRRDRARFLGSQPASCFVTARRAIRAAREGSNLTRGATHFENVGAFGKPKWATSMKEVCTIGRHKFYRDSRWRRRA